jgi:hypothetical protein
VDRDERDVRCYLRRVPMVGRPVDDLTEGLDNGSGKLDAVSQQRSARNRTCQLCEVLGGNSKLVVDSPRDALGCAKTTSEEVTKKVTLL